LYICSQLFRYYELEYIHHPTSDRETPKDLLGCVEDNSLVSSGNCRGYVFGDSLFDCSDGE